MQPSSSPCRTGPVRVRCRRGANTRIPAYLVLLRVGFTVPRTLLPARCALTAPFHPYPEPLTDLPRQITNSGRYILCCTGRPAALTRPSRTLSGTLPCGVRTFLPRLTPFGLSLAVKTAAIIQPPAVITVSHRREQNPV